MRASAVTAAGFAAVALAAAPAFARAAAGGSDPGFPQSTLQLAVSGPRQADSALSIQASGTNAARSDGLRPVDYGLQLIVTDPAILPGACETTQSAELSKIATVRGGGSLLTYSPLEEGSGGPFALREPYEPVGSGPLQICAYSQWGHEDAAWAQTDVRIARAPARPGARTRPVLHRTGELLRCSRGRWRGDPTHFSYRWRVDHGRYGPAHRGARYTLTSRDRGRTVTCEVIARGAGGTGTATSRPLRVG